MEPSDDPAAAAPAPAAVQSKSFALLLVAVSLGFGWILLPFFGAVLWGVIIAVLFTPLQRRLAARLGRRPTLATLLTLLVIVFLVLPPLLLVVVTLAREGAAVFQAMQSGELDFARMFRQIVDALPPWVRDLMARFGLDDMSALLQRLSTLAAQVGQALGGQLLGAGQGTLHFVASFFIALYLAYFLMRDGPALARRMNAAIPLDVAHKRQLLAKFTTVIRATVKGNVVVALTQGALGGLAFWALDVRGALLWAVLMAFLSLLPAVGAGLIWGPVAVYLIVTGSLLQGTLLVAYGVFVIGLVDNLLRPILVGKDTRMPDYVVLISTLGGMSLFGLNGFVIGPLLAAMFIAVWGIYADERGSAD